MRFIVVPLAVFLTMVGAACCASAEPNPDRDDYVRRGSDLLFNARLDQALAVFQELSARYPEDPLGTLLVSKVHWWRVLLILPSTEADGDLRAGIDTTLERAERRLARHPDDLDALFCRGDAISLRARLKGLRENYVGAARDAAKSRAVLMSVFKKDPSYVDALLGPGLYDYLVATMPTLAKVLRVMLFMPGGNKERGIAYVGRVAAEGNLNRTEAALILSSIYSENEHRPEEGLAIITDVMARYSGNLLLGVWKAMLYGQELGRVGDAIEELSSIKARVPPDGEFSRELLDLIPLYQATLKVQAGGYEEAIPDLVEVLDRKPVSPSWILPSAQLLLARVYSRTGSREKAEPLWNEILALKGDDFSRLRREASRDRESRVTPEQAAQDRSVRVGRYLLDLGRCREAVDYFIAQEQAHPGKLVFSLWTGEALLSTGDYAAAEGKLKACLPARTIEVRSRARLRLAQLLDATGRRPEAIALYRDLSQDKTVSARIRENAREGLRAPSSNSLARRQPCGTASGP